MATRSGIALEAEYRVREMLLFVVHCLVDHPDQTEIELCCDSEGSVFCLRAHPADVGKLTENGGRIEKALRCIVLASGRKLGRQLTVEIAEQTGPSN
jgi:predicted RNA-binding protein YlqC (UPF0109 family)